MNDLEKKDKIISILRDRISLLEEKNEMLMEALADKESFRLSLHETFGLTWSETLVLAMLLTREIAYKKSLLILLNFKEYSTATNIITVHIFNIKKKLRRFGFEDDIIQNIWAVGYRINPLNKRLIKERVNAHANRRAEIDHRSREKHAG